MKTFVEEKRASITIEAAIVTTVILILIFTGLTVLINEYMRVLDVCNKLEEEARIFANSGQGEILRIIKVIVDTGGRIADGILQDG